MKLADDTLYSGALAAIAARVSNVALAFLGTVLFARVLSTSDFGGYAFATAVLGLAAVIGQIGLDHQTAKVLAIAYKKSDWPTYWSYLRWSGTHVTIASILTALLFAVCLLFVPVETEVRQATVAIMLGVPFLAITRIQRGRLQATDRTTLGIFVELPVVNFGLLLIACALYAIPSLQSGTYVALLHVAVLMIVVVLGNHLYTSGLKDVVQTLPAQVDPKWRQSLSSFAILGILRLAQMNGFLILAGLVVDAASTGMYAVANRVSFIIFLVLSPIQLVIASPVARAWHAGDQQTVVDHVRKTTVLGLCMAFPIALLLFAFPQFFLGLFGESYLKANETLYFLVIGQVALLTTGPSQMALTMIGREASVCLILASAFGLGIAVAVLLVDKYQLVGIAIGSMVSGIAASLFLVPLSIRLIRREALSP